MAGYAAMAPEQLEGLTRMVDSTLQEVASVRKDLEVLVQCLVDNGSLRAQQFPAAVHRHSFEEACKASPPDCTARLEDLTRGAFARIDRLLSATEASCGLHMGSKSLKELASPLAQVKPHVYIVTGYSGMSGGTENKPNVPETTDVLDVTSGDWTQLPPPSQKRVGCCGAIIKGCIYIAGGTRLSKRGTAENIASCERYDPELASWEDLPPMSTERFGPMGAALGGRFYVVGGSRVGAGGAERLSSTEVLDPVTKQWSDLPPMNERRFLAAHASLQGQLLVCGGNNGVRDLSSLEGFDPSSQQWQRLPSCSQPRMGAAATALDKHFYVCGGRLQSNEDKNLCSVERFDIQTKSWETVPDLLKARFMPAMVVVLGKLWVFGGNEHGNLTPTGSRLDSVEVFDPVQGIWQVAATMPYGRSAHLAVVTVPPSSGSSE